MDLLRDLCSVCMCCPLGICIEVFFRIRYVLLISINGE